MTHTELVHYKKATALNAIRKLLHPKTVLNFTYYEEEDSRREQLCDEIEYIIETLEKELFELKQKANKGTVNNDI